VTEIRNWRAWHLEYDDPNSRLSRRLRVVQRLLRDAIDACPDGAIRIVQMCAGQARDLVGVLSDHPRRTDVTARLVELDEHNADAARASVAGAGLERIEVVTGDAGTSSAYAGVVPADVVIACGIFGNVSDADVERTISFLPRLCASGATVIWTRHPHSPDLTVHIRRWFAEHGFDEVGFVKPNDGSFAVGSHRFTGEPASFEPGVRLFTFFR
jgi:hypothetical protein